MHALDKQCSKLRFKAIPEKKISGGGGGGGGVAVRPNLITWVVGVSLRGRGRKNIICQKKRE